MNSKLSGATDDFKLITGIGPAIERRLHEAGVVTFGQLAGLSPSELADHLQGLAGMSAERIREQEWLRQAEELADLTPLTAASPEESSGNGQHYATFTIEFLLERNNEVRRTRIVHIQHDEQETWAGWEPERLVGFIREQAALRASDKQKAPPAAKELEAPPKPSKQSALSGTPQLRRFEITPSGDSAVRHLLRHKDPFAVHFELDLEDVIRPPDTSMHYVANVHAKRLGDGSRRTVGPLTGNVPPDDQLVIQFPSMTLESGAYRLQAEITLSTPESAKLNAVVDGDLLQVY